MQNVVLQMSNFHKPLRKRPVRITKSLGIFLFHSVIEHPTNGAERNVYTYRRKSKTSISYITQFTKINSRCVKDPNVKTTAPTSLEEI